MMKKVSVMFVIMLFLAGTVWAKPGPLESVERMVDSVLEILDHPELSLQQKKEQVSGRVRGFLSVDSMSQRTLGPYWNEASPEQRTYFVDLFTNILEATYLHRIEDYSGGSVRYLQQRVRDTRAIVDTMIATEGVELPVQYQLVFEEDSWKIFDLVIEGVSLIRNYRSSYAEIIRRQGFDGLFQLMEERLQTMQKS